MLWDNHQPGQPITKMAIVTKIAVKSESVSSQDTVVHNPLGSSCTPAVAACRRGQGGPRYHPKGNSYKQHYMHPLDPPSRDAQGRKQLQTRGASEAGTCQVQITSTTKISGIPQQRVPNSIHQEACSKSRISCTTFVCIFKQVYFKIMQRQHM